MASKQDCIKRMSFHPDSLVHDCSQSISPLLTELTHTVDRNSM